MSRNEDETDGDEGDEADDLAESGDAGSPASGDASGTSATDADAVGDEDGSSVDGLDSAAQSAKERLEAEADRAVEGFDESVVDLLAWILDTETRARIYVYLRQEPGSTSEEVADGTGLYPSTVREALAELHDEDRVIREKRENAGAGNNPYEYEAIAPSELVRSVAGQVQTQLNTVFNLDRRLGGDEEESGPVTITVEDERRE
mgnify:FL=1